MNRSASTQRLSIVAALFTGLVLFTAVAPCRAQQTQPSTTRIRTFDDLLKSIGVNSPAARKYAEDSLKQNLQDQLSEQVDLGFDAEVYLKTLDHLAHGESKQANEYLMKETGKKIVEKLFGKSLAAPVLLAWDFTEYVWTSTQAWAEEQDKQSFHDWMYVQVRKWRTGQDLYQVMDVRDTRTAFNLWWSDNVHRFGKTKMAKDRAAYLLKFEDACRHRMMGLAEKHREHFKAQIELKQLAEFKLNDLRRQAWNESLKFDRASRRIKYAGVTGDMASLVKRYRSDPKFVAEIDRLIAENRKKKAEEIKKVDDEFQVVHDSVKGEIENAKGEIKILAVPLATLDTLAADLESLLNAATSTIEDAPDALASWRVNHGVITSAVKKARNEYDRMSDKPGITQSQRDQVKSEIQKIDKALTNYQKRNSETIARFVQIARNGVSSITAIGKELGALMLEPPYDEKQIDKFEREWKIEFSEVESNNAISVFGKDEAVSASSLNLTWLAPTHWVSYVQKFENGEVALDRIVEFYQRVIDEKISLVERRRANRKQYIELFASREKAIDSVLRNFNSEYRSSQDLIEFSNWLPVFSKVPNQKTHRVSVEPVSNWKQKVDQWKEKHRLQFEPMLTVHIEEMDKSKFDLETIVRKDKSLIATARLILLEMQGLHEQYVAKQQRLNPGTQPIPQQLLTGQAFHILNGTRLVGGKSYTQLFGEMIQKYQLASSNVDGSLNGYMQLAQNSGNLRLDQKPYEQSRLSVNVLDTLLSELNRLFEHHQAIALLENENGKLFEQCRTNIAYLETSRNSAILLRSHIEKIEDEARRLHGKIRDARKPGSSVVWDLQQEELNLQAFQSYVSACQRFKANDDSKIQGLINEINGLVQILPSGQSARLNNLRQAKAKHELAINHVGFMKGYAPYAPTNHFDQRLNEIREQIKKLSANITPPSEFERSGNFFVSLNGAFYGAGSGNQRHHVSSKNGELVIETQYYDPVFQNAKQVMIRLTPAGTQPGPFLTVAKGNSSFQYQTKIEFQKEYRFELRLIASDNRGYQPLPSPFSFVWSKRTGMDQPITNQPVDSGLVQTIRVNRPGETIQFSGPNNRALELKITTGNVNDLAEIHVIRAWELPIQTQYGLVQPWMYAGVVGNRWMELFQFQNNPAASRKFIPADTEEDTTTQVWDFVANVQPHEQFNVYRRVGGGQFQLAYYVIGSSLNSPNTNSTGGVTGNDIGNNNFGNAGNTQGGMDGNVIQNPGGNIDSQAAYQNYISAFNKLKSFMAQGQGDSPQGQQAYEEYKTAKQIYESLELNNANSGNQVQNPDGDDSQIQSQPINALAAYQIYISAYNEMTSLNAQGLGNTPQGQAAYQKYLKAKQVYEPLLNNANAANQLSGNQRPANNAQAAYQTYIAAYNRYTSLLSQGQGNTPQGQAAHAEYERTKAAYEAVIK